jgi:hypothetical protein
MKKPTVREMEWIGKGEWKNRDYRSITARAQDALLLAVSDEDFKVTCRIEAGNFPHGLVISQSEATFIKVDIQDTIIIRTSIRGFGSCVMIPRSSDDKFEHCIIERTGKDISIATEKAKLVDCSLPGCKDAVAFGLFYTQNRFFAMEDFSYSRK